MPVAGLEPARGCPRQILSLLRLPFRHTGLRVVTTRNIIAHFWELGKYKLEKNFFRIICVKLVQNLRKEIIFGLINRKSLYIIYICGLVRWLYYVMTAHQKN